jgi:hypothetical protein
LKEEEFSSEGMNFSSFSVSEEIQSRVGNKPGISGTQKKKRKEDTFEVFLLHLKKKIIFEP